jgi:hypothetical protein
VRITYVGNRTSGQWKAHGRYLSREGATHKAAQREAAFDESCQKLDGRTASMIGSGLEIRALWKIIISPEFGEHLDMPQLTRGVQFRDYGLPTLVC